MLATHFRKAFIFGKRQEKKIWEKHRDHFHNRADLIVSGLDGRLNMYVLSLFYKIYIKMKYTTLYLCMII